MTASHPIFVVGAPRTGTTLVKEILNRHSRIHLFDEVHFFERIWDDRSRIGDLRKPESRARAFSTLRDIVRRFGHDQNVAEVLTDDEFARRLDAEGGDYRGLLAALLKAGAELQGARIWGDSSPQDILYLSTIVTWYRDARIIALVRDPRGFLASYKNYWRRGEASYRERYNPLTNSVLWRSYMRALLDARDGPFAEAVHMISYESLVDNPEIEVQRICLHVGVDYAPLMIDVDATNTSFAGETGSGIVSDSRDRWKTELTPTEIWLGERVCGGIMRDFGYEPLIPGNLSPSILELARIFTLLPGRLFNMLWHSHKPFKMAKVRKAISLFRSR